MYPYGRDYPAIAARCGLYLRASEYQDTPSRAGRMLRHSRKIRELMGDQEFDGDEESRGREGRSITVGRAWDRDDQDEWLEAARRGQPTAPDGDASRRSGRACGPSRSAHLEGRMASSPQCTTASNTASNPGRRARRSLHGRALVKVGREAQRYLGERSGPRALRERERQRQVWPACHIGRFAQEAVDDVGQFRV